ncbi:histidine phosphatase family protein [Alkalihalophilus lindianensis]|uniref:Histidine phosphatase family protein n=1 Tax=Alkalihalophilus lindianensis TaxID=1630542 RepID=A0ABU3X679_9BACI|nr:histidine phosphatase family protein [Alkalihalophilus lindianensis]MDV2683405.1 histidine phosphatase family protein [Alkalihalophilus lindianensis]
MGNDLDVILIRHGLTQYNAERRYLGHHDLPLIEDGLNQMRDLRRLCRTQRVDRVFTSDLTRCQQTAAIVFPSEEPLLVPLLREYHFGDFEGYRYEDLCNHTLYQQWLQQPQHITPPNAETFLEFTERVVEGLKHCLDVAFNEEYTKIALVTHGGVIRYLLSEYAPIVKPFTEWHAKIGSVYRLNGHASKLRRGERFTSLQVEPITGKTIGFVDN